MGPMTYARHLISTPRLPFTAAYFGSIGLTLYFSLGVSPHPPSACWPCLTCAPNAVITKRKPADHVRPPRLAQEHPLDPRLGHLPARLPALVPRQLLPHGLQRPPPRDDVWRQESGRVDVGLIVRSREGEGKGGVICDMSRLSEASGAVGGPCKILHSITSPLYDMYGICLIIIYGVTVRIMKLPLGGVASLPLPVRPGPKLRGTYRFRMRTRGYSCME